ncbi:hypothetical protein [Catenulispora rubra]|uniref:hypothetical protein n=1 Tax=Catenulispora rubra TaxID=280293 RepID=UPI0018926D8C|nr:hypothetical protein [Catenulispora rubra]
MNAFLGEIGKRFAERWATLLAVPGLLYLAATTAAYVLGQHHPFALRRLLTQVTDWAKDPTFRSVGVVVLVVVLILAGSVGAGLAAGVLGWWYGLFLVLPGRRGPTKLLADRRRARSQAARHALEAAPREQVEAIARRADRISLVEADLPTWIGDRLWACRVRVDRACGLHLDSLWPRLWLTLPDSARAEVSAAQESLAGSIRLGGWATLYLVLAWWWWPAALIALIVALTSWTRSRQATRVYADLVESCVDLYAIDVAIQIGLADQRTQVTPELGEKMNALLRKSRWDHRSPLAE